MGGFDWHTVLFECGEGGYSRGDHALEDETYTYWLRNHKLKFQYRSHYFYSTDWFFVYVNVVFSMFALPFVPSKFDKQVYRRLTPDFKYLLAKSIR